MTDAVVFRIANDGAFEMKSPPGRVRITLMGANGWALRSVRLNGADVTDTGISAAYPITGGLLARRPSGSLTLSMEARDGEVELRSAIAGYYPTLAARPGAPAMPHAECLADPYLRVKALARQLDRRRRAHSSWRGQVLPSG